MTNTRFRICDITGRTRAHFGKGEFDNAVRYIEDCNAYGAKESVKPYFIVDRATGGIFAANVNDMNTISDAIKKGACRI